MRSQLGAVLFLALIVLLVMTLIGVGLATNSGLSMRMSGAGAERIAAMAVTQGAQTSLLNNSEIQIKLANIEKPMASSTITQGQQLGTRSIINPLHDGYLSCQRTTKASSTNLISCRRVELSTTSTFGRQNLGTLTITSAIEKEVLTGS